MNKLDAERKVESGIVQDKWIAARESEFGSIFVPKLLVKLETGGQSTIKVDQKLYERVETGTVIKRNDKGEFEIVQE